MARLTGARSVESRETPNSVGDPDECTTGYSPSNCAQLFDPTVHDPSLESYLLSSNALLIILFGGCLCIKLEMSSLKLYHEILHAQERISAFINKTPVVTSSTLDKLVGRKVFLKCETFQKTGSFKARGALNAVLKLKEKTPNIPGVVTHSSGNHGQALAWAARTAGLPCSVVVPNNSPKVKCEAIRGYGADLVLCEPTPQSRANTCNAIAEETGRLFIPPFDHHDVIAGQGTIALEFLSQQPELDAILVPISGGGMTSGIAIATRSISPKTKVFAIEPIGKNLSSSLQAGERLWQNPPKFLDTIADGIRFQQVGFLTFPILCELVEKQVFSVSDEEMIEAMKFAFQRMKLVVEPSSAAGIAAVMSRVMSEMDPSLQNIGVILCGGNVDIDALPWY